MDTVPDGLTFRPDLLDAGVTPQELRRWCRDDALVRVRRGAYVRAAVHQLGRGAVVSHVSAAVVHGLPTWGLSLQRVHVTRARRSGARRDRLVHVHAAALADDEVAVLADGTRATCAARTVVDVARGAPFAPAVAVADAALRAGLVTPAELDDAVERSTRRPGTPAARRVARFADGRSESVGESRSRTAIHLAGLPAPALQWALHDERGLLVARTDFGWPEHHTVGEFDGLAKYGRLRRSGQSPGEAVVAEKLREDRIRDLGLRVVRWTWAELDPFTAVHGRLARALDA